jgi:transposase
VNKEYVGIDLHRRRSVIVRKSAEGEVLSKVHIVNDPVALVQAVEAAGPEPEVVLEATFGWYWAADVLAEMGAKVHLAHPLGNNWGNRRVKNDERDAADLVDLLRMGRLAEAWIAPPELRELRELVRYRHKLCRLRSGLKAQVHAVMGKHGVLPAWSDMFGKGGNAQLDGLDLPEGYSFRLESLRDLIIAYDREIISLDRRIAGRLAGHPGYRAIQAIDGVGPILAAVFVAEIGDVARFPTADRLCSWAGLTPKHRESDTKLRRGSISKQGSRLLRWAAVEAVQKNHAGGDFKAAYRRIAERRGRNIAKVAAGRKVLTLVYYGLRDGHIRCLAPATTG